MNTWSRALTLPALMLAVGCSGGQESVASSCLMQAAQAPCEILTAGMIAPLLPEGVEMPQAEAKEFAGVHRCTYTWDGGRTRTTEVSTMSMELPVPDEVRLTRIQQEASDPNKAASQFQARYSTRTDAEKAEMAKEASERAAEKVDGEHQDMASDFAARLINSLAFEPVANLGDVAAWGGAGKNRSLHVLSGTVSFEILVNRSSEPEQRKQDSVQLAKDVLETCS